VLVQELVQVLANELVHLLALELEHSMGLESEHEWGTWWEAGLANEKGKLLGAMLVAWLATGSDCDWDYEKDEVLVKRLVKELAHVLGLQ
jgi:hypothetical protein